MGEKEGSRFVRDAEGVTKGGSMRRWSQRGERLKLREAGKLKEWPGGGAAPSWGRVLLSQSWAASGTGGERRPSIAGVR